MVVRLILKGCTGADDDVDSRREGEADAARGNDDECAFDGECLQIDVERGTGEGDDDVGGDGD